MLEVREVLVREVLEVLEVREVLVREVLGGSVPANLSNQNPEHPENPENLENPFNRGRWSFLRRRIATTSR